MSHIIRTRLSPELYQFVAQQATLGHRTISDWLRLLIADAASRGGEVLKGDGVANLAGERHSEDPAITETERVFRGSKQAKKGASSNSDGSTQVHVKQLLKQPHVQAAIGNITVLGAKQAKASGKTKKAEATGEVVCECGRKFSSKVAYYLHLEEEHGEVNSESN